ncbi:fibronectin type III-like domain-contianing protein [Streptomyces violaceochromogenes]|uniref:Fibronectin type III-like domain-contianing protein n=1 Tax=Streptomyces violaceochromogenes TaxID=67377 RepID=A0ABU6LRF2_9ACTN|nr:fibronectin type III-like domain-contianing protein [Streptomyces violaceochromogenes]MEC7050756.1 fibronectin type III-like domain-contianing protein [Streptomyces violaceochromogenes]GHC94721.1 hypothetical protein GCM10010309_80410 [Streptomyces violaceochromogenes]
MTLTRAGRRPARETVQAYARDRVTSVTWTDREVKAFTQVGVEPGERVEVMIVVLAGDCTVAPAAQAVRRGGGPEGRRPRPGREGAGIRGH